MFFYKISDKIHCKWIKANALTFQVDSGDDSLIMLDTSSMPEMKNYPNLKEKEEKLKMIVEQGDGRKYKWTKLDMQKFQAVAAKVIQLCYR